MATWEDGPEYAPAERPADFSVPEAPPLEAPSPDLPPVPAAPQAQPVFHAPPPASVPDLTQLVPVVQNERDPVRPFDVASSTGTSMESAWGAAHWSSPGSAPPPPVLTPLVATPLTGAPWPAPPAAPAGQGWGAAPQWPAPTAPFPPVSGPPQQPNGFPPPGTPQWFGPGPVPLPPPPNPVRYDTRSVLDAATPGLCICLVVGGLTSLFAPAMLVVSYFLAARVKVAQRQVRAAMGAGLGGLVFFAVVGYLTYGVADSLWWDFLGGWGQALCWLLLVTVLLLVRRALKRRSGQPPGAPSSWG